MADEPETTEQAEQAEPEVKDLEFEKYPPDHPLVTAFERQKQRNVEMAAQLQKIEDANKTDEQRRDEAATLTDKRASTAEAEAMRLRVALVNGLTLMQAKRLIGDDEEALAADAEELLASFAPAEPSVEVPRRPHERLKAGVAPTEPPPDHEALADEILSRGW